MSLMQATFLGLAGDIIAQLLESRLGRRSSFEWNMTRTKNLTLLAIIVGQVIE
jgi:hypothetical protein